MVKDSMKARDSSLWSIGHLERSANTTASCKTHVTPCKDLDRSMQPSLHPSIRTPRRSSATFGQFRAGLQSSCSRFLREAFRTPYVHIDSLKKPALKPGSRLEWPPADGKCRQCSGRWQCPETVACRLRGGTIGSHRIFI